MKVSDKTVREWKETRDIIKTVLKKLNPNMTETQHDHNAAAIIARLAQTDYIICKTDDMKDES